MAKDKTTGDEATKPAAESTGPAKRKFRCSIPADKIAPTIEVEAETAGDAHLEYKKAAGIISTEHEIVASLAD